MTYQTLEALLVQKIAGLRQSEAFFAQALRSAQTGAAGVNLSAANRRIQAQLHEVEQLLEAMESAPSYAASPIPSLLPIEAAQQITPSAWM